MGRTRREEELNNLSIYVVKTDKTSDEMINDFNEKVGTFSATVQGLASLNIGLKIQQEGKDLEKAHFFVHKALKSLDTHDNHNKNKLSLVIAFTLQLLGFLHSELDRLCDSVGYLLRANVVLGMLKDKHGFSDEDYGPILSVVQVGLANTYVKGENYKEALPFSLKALELHTKWHNSVKVGYDRVLLADIYSGLGEHEKALKQYFLAQRTFKKHHLNIDFIGAKIHAADMMIALGRYDEAVGNLKNVLPKKMDEDSEGPRAHVHISMANAYCNQGKFGECKKYLEISLGILRTREYKCPSGVANAYTKISLQYETMKEFETAISLLKRTLALLEMLPKEQSFQGRVSRKIGMLLLLIEKWQQAIPYLESAAERLKYSYGPMHFKVGGIYNNLGKAYLGLDRPQLAAEMFAVAKDIYDVSLDQDHADRIAVCQNLAKAYDEMGSYEVAIEFEQLVIDARESHGAIAEDELKEANQVLEELKKKASDASANESPIKALS